MKTLVQTINDSLTENDIQNCMEQLNEMSNISKRKTHLPVIVWIEAKEITRHNLPRIKFQNSYSDKVQPTNLVPMLIDDNPKVLGKNINLAISTKDIETIRQWVIRNKTLLLQYWNYEITSDDVIDNII